MAKYNKGNGRKNMRLHGYDYSRVGLYFLTIVVQNRLHLFGEIRQEGDAGPAKMFLNDAGNMIEKWYYEIENKFPDKRCHEMIVMPNHFHCIIENMESDGHDEGMDGHDRMDAPGPAMDAPVRAPLRGRPMSPGHPQYGIHNKRYGATIGDVMDWFKTMTTNAYIRGVKINNWRRFDGRLWQCNYYDHIIRDDNALRKISEYIIHNPDRWHEDKFNRK